MLAYRINKTISRQTSFDISFSHIEIDMFPPATYLKNVSIRNRLASPQIEIEAGSLSLSFGLSDFFSNRFSVQKVGIEDANILIKGIKKKGQQKIEYNEIFPKLKNILQVALPVKIGGVHIKRSYVESEFITGYFEYCDVIVYKSVLEANIKAHALKVDKSLIKDSEYRSFDYVTLGFHLNEEKLLLKKGEIWKDSQRVIVDGALLFKKNLEFNGSVYLRGLIEKIKYINTHKYLKDVGLKGVFEFKSEVKSDLTKSFEIDGSLRLIDFRSEYANVDNVYTEFTVNEDNLIIDQLMVEDGKGIIELEDKIVAYNFKDKKISNDFANFKVSRFKTNSILYSIRDKLSILKGDVTGQVSVQWDDDNVNFDIKKDSKLENFVLDVGAESPILKNKEVKIESGFVQVLPTGEVYLGFDLRVGDYSFLKADGFIGSKKIDIKVTDSEIDLAEVGPISGLQLYGKGPFLMNISGGGKDVVFDFKVDFVDVDILDYQIKKLKGDISLDLRDLVLSISNTLGRFSNTKYTSDGYINFKDGKINLSIDLLQTDLEDSLIIFKPLVKAVSFMDSPHLGFTYKAKVKINGDLNPEGIRVYGIVDGSDLKIFKEKSESLSFNFEFLDNVLKVDKLKMRHGSSKVLGKASVNTKSQYFEYDAKIIDGQLEDLETYRILNLGFASEFAGEFYGNGTFDDFSTRSHVKFTNSFLGNVQVPESFITIYNNSKEVFSSGNFLGDRVTYNLYLNFDDKTKQKSYLNSFLDFRDIRELISVISNHNMELPNISGKTRGSFTSSFSMFNLSDLSLNLVLSEFEFTKGSKSLFIDGEKALFNMVDGEIKEVDFRLISDSDDYLVLNGKGSLKDNIVISEKFKIDASFLELLSSKISKSTGLIKGQGNLKGSVKNLTYDHSFSGEDIFLKIIGVPSSFSSLGFDILLDQNSILVNKLDGYFGKGEINGSGLIKLVLPYPVVDLSLEFTNSYIPLFKKSGVLLSGNARVEGSDFPYLLSGSITVLNGTINDELQDLSPPSVSGRGVYQKYVPESKFDNRFDYFDLDLSIGFDKPIVVRNLLADLRLVGSGRIKGKVYKPSINGVVEVVPGLSKLLFKGNEFVIKEGSLSFSEDKGLIPELRFNGNSSINQYNINLDVYGLANDPQLSVTSDPFLKQEDIFSLLTLGFTSEISEELEEKDRRSATTLGIGTLLFDQLLKNQGLSSNLGLKLSVLPEFEENESSLLKGKSGVSDTGSSRYKSATKIKLEKKISKDVDLSLASTVGGSAEQKQEMNVNYNILKNVSLEGVYEINSASEEQSKDPTSFGIDLKIQWTY
ncbi:hypothetical protein A9Q84_21450 [Halobacteriovorax marinus]|uniref:Translocation and assembly module TamB C-terminal domain-containing protein n=1 Tax=Halobacteriovorax marinus TaxID=97084 RepID=A0A1Y5F5P4_9BACT|nr:hypothetical protein A9Q84_21450 [Halobacteriovorax marinus]